MGFVDVEFGIAVRAIGEFVVSFDKVFGGVGDDVEAHEEEEDGHCEPGEDFGSF